MQKDINQVILFQLDKTSKVAKQYSQKKLDELDLGITIDQWVLLKVIHENSPLSQKDLAIKALRDPASITRTLDILEKKRLIVREAIKGNRRQYDIILTKEGNAFVDHNMALVTSLRELSVKGFSNEELKTLSSYLLRIQENMT